MSVSGKRRPPRRPKSPEPDVTPLKTVTLRAKVSEDWLPPSEAWIMSPTEFASLAEVDERTVRRWVEHCGCPQVGTLSRPQYDKHAYMWWRQWRLLGLRNKRRRPKYLSLATARTLHLEECQREAASRGGWAEYVLVPLRHDHPLREWALERACDGMPEWSGGPAELDPSALLPADVEFEEDDD
jgi:hypothetical protein